MKLYYSGANRSPTIQYARISPQDIIDTLRSSSGKSSEHALLRVPNFYDVTILFGLHPISDLKYSIDGITRIAKQINRDIIIFMTHRDGNGEDIIYPKVSPRLRFTDNEPIRILLDNTDEPDYNSTISNFRLILDPDCIPKVYYCNVLERCNYSTNRFRDYTLHTSICLEKNTQEIESVQAVYGKDRYVIKNLIDEGYLPADALNFRKNFIVCFDIEAFEHLLDCDTTANQQVIALHKLLSIAIGTNTGKQNCFVRQDSTHESAAEIVKLFVDELEVYLQDHHKSIPHYFEECLNLLDAAQHDDSILKKKRMILGKWAGSIKKYLKMDVFGFNSGNNIY